MRRRSCVRALLHGSGTIRVCVYSWVRDFFPFCLGIEARV